MSDIVCDTTVNGVSRGLSNSLGSVDYSHCSTGSLKQLFEEQHRFLNYFFDNLEYGPLQSFCEACLNCKGVLCFSGVGKSGFIAQKITQTLVSTGTKAVFLSPTDALHGDIGIVGPDDLLVLLSKSGGTEELLRLVPYARAKGAKLVSVTSVKGNKLEAACDMAIHLPLERELCPFDLAPVTSTAIQMLFGDTVAISLMLSRNLTKDEYAMNHPAGRIGKRLMLRVDDVMLTGEKLPLVTGEVKVVDTLVELSSKGCGCVLVVDNHNKLLGTFTDGDLRRTLQSIGPAALQTHVSEVMSKSPTVISAGAKAVDAMQTMEKGSRKVAFLPVVDDSSAVKGVVTLHGLVSAGL
uniref:Arabinose-5-phosphate isomerase n=1 Tax=Tetraselmis sp. GSL018 TaxID=582737 RepID=A0A061SPM1_9CHLO|mmetsp:Transcript_33114/g.78536  ORF Transcript_33114/g.78536 Transcript_33114/m.78536 type:complete len:351 (+) Transcript_33114:168-1220(+)